MIMNFTMIIYELYSYVWLQFTQNVVFDLMVFSLLNYLRKLQYYYQLETTTQVCGKIKGYDKPVDCVSQSLTSKLPQLDYAVERSL